MTTAELQDEIDSKFCPSCGAQILQKRTDGVE